MTAKIVKRNKSLLQAFRKYKEHYSNAGKKPDVRKSLPNDLYHTMRLEGEKITRKQAQDLFK